MKILRKNSQMLLLKISEKNPGDIFLATLLEIPGITPVETLGISRKKKLWRHPFLKESEKSFKRNPERRF